MPRRSRGDTQQLILDYIVEQTKVKGYPPSVREIGEAVGLKSTSTVHGHLQRLEKKGLLHRDPMKPRAIDVSANIALEENVRSVPILGRVAAGSPILAEQDYEGTIQLPEEMIGHSECFVLAVRGESMIEAGIMDGDYVVVRKQSEAHNGDIVVAMIDGDATVKRFYRERGHIRLQPENSTMRPIITKKVTILGKVTASYRLL